ncbi:MAG: PQQ-binding-like beta-propeller repeat protein [Acidobacteria bacterium]|nr:PQQ-binding-like beta-propeller repeat protein [Acidobacteriota bacterium]
MPLKAHVSKVLAIVILMVALMGHTVPMAAGQSGELTAPGAAGDWSRFRGPNGNGVADTSNLPTEVGPDTNVIWATPLPEGHSSPILSADKIFLTAVDGTDLQTIALDRASGEILWRRSAPADPTDPPDPRNNPASPSPVTDGEIVVVFFADYGMIAYDVDGEELWSLPLGPFDNVYGMGASPILFDDMVILAADQTNDSYLLAVSREDGSTIWKTDRPEAKSGHATPILWEDETGRTQLLIPGSFFLTAYDASNGEKLWWVSGLSFEIKSTPVIYDGMVFVNGFGSPMQQPGRQPVIETFEEALLRDADHDGKLNAEELEGTRAAGWMGFTDLDHDGAFDADEWAYFKAAITSTNGVLAIKLGGEGDMTEQNVAWTYHRAVPQLPSPLVYEGVLYMINDGGIVTSFDPATGEVLAQGRLQGAVDAYYASPVAADGKIYFVSELGLVAVIEPGGGLGVVSVGDLDDLVYGTPAIDDSRIYLRTRNTLYCFGLQ